MQDQKTTLFQALQEAERSLEKAWSRYVKADAQLDLASNPSTVKEFQSAKAELHAAQTNYAHIQLCLREAKAKE